MTREQVIKGLECCGANSSCIGCPYINYLNNGCMDKLNVDALALLKEQEPIPVKRIDGKHNHFIKCGNCNTDLMSGMRYCPQCGQAVKWE